MVLSSWLVLARSLPPDSGVWFAKSEAGMPVPVGTRAGGAQALRGYEISVALQREELQNQVVSRVRCSSHGSGGRTDAQPAVHDAHQNGCQQWCPGSAQTGYRTPFTSISARSFSPFQSTPWG